jgi:transcriptional regulator with XRE-family HTH domain
VNPLTKPTLNQIILKNIRRLRNEKNMSSKEIAYEIGMKPPEYSKLEKGKKQNIEKYISKIAAVLCVEKYELMMEEVENISKRSYLSEETTELLEKQKEEYIRLFKELDEKDKATKVAMEAKDALIKRNEETILDLKITLKYWQDKYYRIKAKLVDAENRMKEFLKKTLRKEKPESNQSISSLGNVGGGMISLIFPKFENFELIHFKSSNFQISKSFLC